MAESYFDPTSGDDTTGDGSYSTPYKTLNKAATEASDGDTIRLVNGTHTLTYNETASTSINKNLTITSESDDATLAILDGDNYTYYTWWRVYGAVTVTFKNITITKMKNTGGNGSFTVNPVFVGSNTIIDGMIWDDTYCGGGSYGVVNANGNNQTVTIRNCIVKNLPPAGLHCFFSSFANTSAVTHNIYNNTFYLNTDNIHYGIIYSPSTNSTYNFKNNIVYNSSGTAQVVAASGDATETVNLHNNCFHANSGAVTETSGSWGTVDSQDNITTDPLFVSAATGNFKLRPTSPCIGTGTNV